jgi:hypothetical protein
MAMSNAERSKRYNDSDKGRSNRKAYDEKDTTIIKRREIAKQYQLRHPNEAKESKLKYRNSEKGKQTEKEYKDKYKPKANENQRKYYATNKNDPEYYKHHLELRRLDYHRNKDKNRNKRNERNRQRYQKIKKEVMSGYCNGDIKCSICEIKDIDVLTIDHIYGGGRRLRAEFKERAGCNFYRDLIRNNFPDEYRVLCFNCNHKEALRLELRSEKVSDETIKKYPNINGKIKRDG